MKKNGFAPLIIILVIAILGVVGYFGHRSLNFGSFKSVGTQPSPTPLPTFDTVTWESYTNPDFKYKIQFPKSFKIGSDAGMFFETNAIILESADEKSLVDQEYFAIQAISLDGINKNSLCTNKVESAHDLAKCTYDKSVGNKNTYFQLIKPIQETSFDGSKAYEYELDENGAHYIFGSQVVERANYITTVFERDGYYFLIIHADTALFNKIFSTIGFTK